MAEKLKIIPLGGLNEIGKNMTAYEYGGAWHEALKEYLDGNRPFLKEHYFQIHYWKQFIKRLLHYHA